MNLYHIMAEQRINLGQNSVESFGRFAYLNNSLALDVHSLSTHDLTEHFLLLDCQVLNYQT